VLLINALTFLCLVNAGFKIYLKIVKFNNNNNNNLLIYSALRSLHFQRLVVLFCTLNWPKELRRGCSHDETDDNIH
jgi:hypothetical protein